MAAVSRAFWETSQRAGLVIGIIPCEPDGPVTQPRKGYPNRWVEIPIFTHLPLSGERGGEPMSRNHINVLSLNVVVALPGGPGTASEVALALEYGRPMIAFLSGRDEIPGLPKDVAVESDFDKVKEFVRSKLPQQEPEP
jgi:predicted Rossmann-fold nucleotide-binding protein